MYDSTSSKRLVVGTKPDQENKRIHQSASENLYLPFQSDSHKSHLITIVMHPSRDMDLSQPSADTNRCGDSPKGPAYSRNLPSIKRRHRDSTSSGTAIISTFKRSRTAASKIHMREFSSDGAQGPPTHQLWSAFSELTNAQAYQSCSPAACQFAGRTPSRSEWSGSRHRSIDTVRSSAGSDGYWIIADST